ncbi:U5 small ribonucleoprotein-specific helicase, putative [Theileria equi strain WA]|uniref:U5 small nuclear ribonucleoprotein 200 kDa helicase n=1 Tax=Theileria equi strain WA TaxID=1537102 RepID=L1LCX2_THEEQ|nr:U5 small ribonucleoprotein-specific helicase, putative [Theileria equi strain WA]EKX73191.1 U5 small ribonucleoprotein-specific helicase, putative [Theileria equi strain WA]|eukprot:XP_004832643.1 U5 small ribonucleoprotein-specific helicase, putative [Theileria equi strain WA]
MAEQYERFKRFEYRMNSNLVIQREGPGPRQGESTGEPESLVGRLKHRMGDRVSYTSVKPRSEKLKSRSMIDAPKRKQKAQLDVNANDSVLNVDLSVGTFYVPSSNYTRAKYEELLNMLQQSLGDQPQDVLKGALEEVLFILKSSDSKGIDRKAACEELLGPISDDLYYRLYHTSKELIDFTLPGDSKGTGTIDDNSGVAVVFDEDEDANDANSDGYYYEVPADEEFEHEKDSKAAVEFIRQDSVQDESQFETDKYHLPISRIDSHWLQRELNLIFGDPNVAVATEKEILSAIKIEDVQECENRLVLILKYENFEFAKLVLKNRWKIMYCTRLGQSQTPEEKARIFEEMKKTPEGLQVLQELEVVNLRRSKEQELALNVKREAASLSRKAKMDSEDKSDNVDDLGLDAGHTDFNTDTDVHMDNTGNLGPKIVDLESMAFKDGSHHMSNVKVVLPEGSERIEHKSYDEVVIYPLERPKGLNRKPIQSLPEWAQKAFPNIESLNPVQSAVWDIAFNHFDENMLICAPTGSGKTNIAVLCILNIFSRYIDENGSLDSSGFKIVYVSPMKSLVMEQTQAFTKRFTPFGINVSELTGDISMTRREIENTQLIVTTPEKWDVVTRRSGFESSVELMIFDEIHLLHDKRGPVLEALVSRVVNNDRRSGIRTRLVGLSATLPNFRDISDFLCVNPDRGLFYFGNHYRPVGLEQRYIGIKEKKAIKKFNTVNEILFERVIEDIRDNKNQILIFVHSRRETVRTAKFIRDTALLKDTLSTILTTDSASREILSSEAEAIKNAELKELLPYGFGIHHAGLPRSDRKLVEDLFADGHIQILVSTATLSWGVNLPAQTVIIKGTQIYSPEEGCWTELCPLSVQQMMGRAGRPQYDKEGKGIIITSHEKLQFYLSLNNQQLPIESQIISKLPELLNAEIVLSNISSLEDCVSWLKDTYLYVRMRMSPELYGIELHVDGDSGTEPLDHELIDNLVLERLRDIAHTALSTLDKHGIVRYERKSGTLLSTGMGRIASLYYLKPESIRIYADNLKPNLSDSDILKVFASSLEFRYIPVREEEKIELLSLMEKVPIPIRGSTTDPNTHSKISILLQAYISGLELEGYALISEMGFITQNAGRIIQALYTICLKRCWSRLSQKLFDLGKMVEKRMWNVMLPLRQFKSLPEELVIKLERKDFSWDRYYDLSSVELGELCRQPKLGKSLHKLVHLIPKLNIQVFIQPLTRSRLSLEVTISPEFQWDTKYHGYQERFWLFVEDGNGENILYSTTYILPAFSANDVESLENSIFFTVPIAEPLHYNYFLRIVSEKWIGSSTSFSILFNKLILPERDNPHTELLDLQPVPKVSLYNRIATENSGISDDAKKIFTREFFSKKFGTGSFNPIQTQVFSAIYSGNDSVLLCAPYKTGKFTCAEIAICRSLSHNLDSTIIVISAFESTACARYERLMVKFGDICKVGLLTGDFRTDLRIIAESSIVISIPKHWDYVSRRWKSKKCLQSIDLFIVENLELINDYTVGPEIEICVSRMRFISAQLGNFTRIIGLSISISNAHDVAGWIGAPSTLAFSFDPSKNNIISPVIIQPFDQSDPESRKFAMFTSICKNVFNNFPRSSIVFTTGRKFCRLIAMELYMHISNLEQLHMDSDTHTSLISSWNIYKDEELDTIQTLIDRERALSRLLMLGVCYCHEGFSPSEVRVIEKAFKTENIKVLILTSSLAWNTSVFAPLVIVADTATSSLNRPINHGFYPQADILRIISHTRTYGNDKSDSLSSIIMLESSQRDHYKKLIHEAYPVESALENRLEELVNAEIVQGAIENPQDAIDWLTWTLYYRRLLKNPNYYSLQGVSGSHLSEHLSELVENVFSTLEKSQCATVEEESISPLNLGFISAFYYLKCATIELYAKNVSSNSGRDSLLEILSYSEEFSDIPLRAGERIHNLSLDGVSVSTKVKLLLQCHLDRSLLSNDLTSDQRLILTRISPLIYALVDVICSNGWLSPALIAMDLCQRTIQAMGVSDSPLKQLPNVSTDFIDRSKEFGVNDLFDLIGMEDEDRNKLLEGFSKRHTFEIAAVCNAVQVLDVRYSLNVDKVGAGELLSLHVDIDREGEDVPVHAPYFPLDRQEQWWVLIGESETNKLYGIKRVSLSQQGNKVKLDFEAPSQPGKHTLILYIVSDSYVATDHQYPVEIEVH